MFNVQSSKFAYNSLKNLCSSTVFICGLLFAPWHLIRFAQIPTPKSVLGFQPTDDKTIADWSQITNYFQSWMRQAIKSRQRNRQNNARQTDDRRFYFVAAKISKISKNIRQINQKLANPNLVKDKAELENLVKNGKTIVSISCSIHSTEIVASQMSMNLAHELASAKDDGNQRNS